MDSKELKKADKIKYNHKDMGNMIIYAIPDYYGSAVYDYEFV